MRLYRSLKIFINDYERAERARRNFRVFRQKHSILVNSLLVNHILVVATCSSILNTHNIYGLDQETRNLRNVINDYERAERASRIVRVFRPKHTILVNNNVGKSHMNRCYMSFCS